MLDKVSVTIFNIHYILGVDYETATHMEGNLATEASMLVLDTLDLIVQIVSHTDHSQGLLASVLRVLLHALHTNQSTMFLQHLFAGMN